jgi:hypothetical protein
MKKRHRIRTTAVAILMAAGVTVAPTAPATAAGDAGAHVVPGYGLTAASATLRATRSGAVTSNGTRIGPASNPPDVIVCYLDVSNPRGPDGFAEVSASGLVICSYPVDFISVSVELYRNNVLVASRRQTVPFVLGWGVTASAPCVSGTYLAIATGEVVFPSGYFPPIGSGVVGSASVNITCGPPPGGGQQAPFGALDIVEVTSGNWLHISGWAINPTPGGSVHAEFQLGPRDHAWYWTFGTAQPTLNRPDVGVAYPQYGPNHGFETDGPEDTGPSIDPENPGQFIFPGDYDLCVIAATGYRSTELGCRPVHITQELLSWYWS